MQPLQQLLSRIAWDKEFGRGEFALGYYDRVLDDEVVAPIASVTLEAGRRTFTFTDPDGVTQRIPLHRVRKVYKDGAVLWSRPPRPGR